MPTNLYLGGQIKFWLETGHAIKKAKPNNNHVFSLPVWMRLSGNSRKLVRLKSPISGEIYSGLNFGNMPILILVATHKTIVRSYINFCYHFIIV